MSALKWEIMCRNPLIYEARPAELVQYHVTVADDGEIRGQKLSGSIFKQTWVSDPAQSYDEAKTMCAEHWALSLAEGGENG